MARKLRLHPGEVVVFLHPELDLAALYAHVVAEPVHIAVQQLQGSQTGVKPV